MHHFFVEKTLKIHQIYKFSAQLNYKMLAETVLRDAKCKYPGEIVHTAIVCCNSPFVVHSEYHCENNGSSDTAIFQDAFSWDTVDVLNANKSLVLCDFVFMCLARFLVCFLYLWCLLRFVKSLNLFCVFWILQSRWGMSY